MKREGKFEVYRGKGTQPWRVRWRSRNGKNVWRSSEGYPTKRLAQRAAMSIKFGALQSLIVVKS